MAKSITLFDSTKTNDFSAWVVCLTGALFFFYEFIQMHMFNAISEQLLHEFSLTAVQLGNLAASYLYATVLFLFIAGTILDRFSTRIVMLVALSICVAGTFLFAIAQTYQFAMITRFFTGIGSAFCFLACIRLASRWFPASRMALITGLIVTMAMVGGMVAQTPLTLLTDALGWRYALTINGCLGLLIILVIFIVVQDYPHHEVAVRHEERQKLHLIGYWKGFRLAFLKAQNWLGGIYTSTINLPLMLLGGVWGSMYLVQVHHLDRQDASYVTSMIFLGTIIGSPLVGWLSDRIERRKWPMIIGAILSFALILIIMFAHDLALGALMFIFFALGLVSSSQIISYPTVAENNTELLTATAVSVVSITTMSGAAIAEPFFGWLMELHWKKAVPVLNQGIPVYTVGDFQFAMWLFPLTIIVGFVAALLIRETYCRRQ
jgi:MFS family permease